MNNFISSLNFYLSKYFIFSRTEHYLGEYFKGQAIFKTNFFNSNCLSIKLSKSISLIEYNSQKGLLLSCFVSKNFILEKISFICFCFMTRIKGELIYGNFQWMNFQSFRTKMSTILTPFAHQRHHQQLPTPPPTTPILTNQWWRKSIDRFFLWNIPLTILGKALYRRHQVLFP